MDAREACVDDVDAVWALQQRWDIVFLGAPEHDRDDVWESLGGAEPMAQRTRLWLRGAELVAAAWCRGGAVCTVVDPDADPGEVYVELLTWVSGQQVPELEALSTDQAWRQALQADGWRYSHSSFDLFRTVEDWVLAVPRWPGGVTVTGLRADDAPAVYELIYSRAGWAQTLGHHQRTYADWYGHFLASDDAPDEHVLAWRGERLIGCSIGHNFVDGTGWIAQLAVARDDRGQGLGRALLLDSLRRRKNGGASVLGLQVMAGNQRALAMYQDIGLEVAREWTIHRTARAVSGPGETGRPGAEHQ